MKKLTLILGVAFAVFFSGCTVKNQTDIEPYVSMHSNKAQDIKVNLVAVNDKRTTNIVSTIYHKGDIAKQYPLSNNVKTWYTNAFVRELTNTDMLEKTKQADVKVTVNILRMEAKYKRYSMTKSNIEAKINLELVLETRTAVLKSNININQRGYKPIMLDANGFKAILNESMKDSVSKTIAIMIRKLKR